MCIVHLCTICIYVHCAFVYSLSEMIFVNPVTGHELMCPSSWKLYVDDFPFFGSSLACLEPELELFEVWAV